MLGSKRSPRILKMPFFIELMPANPGDLSTPPPHYSMAIEQAVRASDGHLGPRGAVSLNDGGQFIFENNHFWPKRLTPDVCRAIFDAALHTNTYVDTGGSDVSPLKVKGSTLKTPSDMGPAVVVANSDVLCTILQSRLTRWNQDMGRLRREGVIDANDQPLEPPSDPGTEPRLSSDPTGLAAQCEEDERKAYSSLGWKFVRSVITRNAQWGVVWRADVAPEADRATWFRVSCWRSRSTVGKEGISISSRPLEMFDKSQNAKLLPAE